MKLDDIGFYTLTEKRAETVSFNSDLQRCELILTDRRNFKCPYCRGIKKDLQGDLTLEQAKNIIDIWSEGNIRNVRFSGGEPTLWKDLVELVKYTKSKQSIEHIGVSTNGSAPLELYRQLCDAGVNDFSVSFDACCSITADKMAGTNAHFNKLCNTIRELSKMTYTTVGVVLDDRNSNELQSIVNLATNLGVHDIRVIPSAQWNQMLKLDVETNFKILSYRIKNLKSGVHVRGIQDTDCHKCHLVKDDMIVLHGKHFPCVIYMREQGKEIGTIEGKTIDAVRKEREEWFNQHDSHADPICSKNCLDFCKCHNNKVENRSEK